MSPVPDRSTPPRPGSLRPFTLPPVTRAAIPGGLSVEFVRDARAPLVSGVLVLLSGEGAVAEAQAGLAGVVGDTLQGGTARRTGEELAVALEEAGTSLRVAPGWEASTVSFTCTAERLDHTLALMAEVIREPSFPEEEVERVRRQRLAALAQRAQDPGALADDEADRTLYPEGHPWRRNLLGTAGSLEGLGRGDAMAWAEAAYRPEGGGLVLVGDLDAADLVRRVEGVFAGWSGAPLPPHPLPPVALPNPRAVVIRHRPGAVQSEIRIVHPGPARSTPDYAALQVANSILGGSFTSRLNLNLRERHGFTYGVRSGFALRRSAGSFEVSTAVETAVTARAIEESLFELRRFVAEGPTEDEVARTRDYLAGIFPLRMETGAQLAGRVAELIAFGLPEDEHHTYRDRIRGVDREMAHAAIRAHLDPERAIVVCSGDASEIRTPLEALALGPVEVRE
jgi:zinc protease